MALSVEDYGGDPVRSPGPEKRILTADIVIGGGGAVSSIDGDAGISATHGAAGIYNVTFPPCADVKIGLSLLSATVSLVRQTAKSATAGTAALIVENDAGADTDPASGDRITLILVAEIR